MRLSRLHYFTAHVEDTVDQNGKKIPGYASSMVSIYSAFCSHIAPSMDVPDLASPACFANLDCGEDRMCCDMSPDELRTLDGLKMEILIDLSRGIDYRRTDDL